MVDDNSIILETPLAVVFPLPFRVLFLGGLGILCWATNLNGLHLLGIDIISVLGVGSLTPDQQIKNHTASHNRTGSGFQSILSPDALYAPVYKFFIAYSTWGVLGWLLFRYSTQDDIHFVDSYKYILIIMWLVILAALVAPYNVLYRHERDRFLL